MKLSGKQIRDLDEAIQIPEIKRYPITFILDNLYDTYNIGGIFRLADAYAIQKIYICGESETPPNHRIAKASIGTYKIVPWEYQPTVVDAIKKLRSENPEIQILCVEQSESSVAFQSFDYHAPLAIIVGNETTGVSRQAMEASDAILEIPMFGINSSLNVIVSTAVVVSHIYSKMDPA